MKIFTLKRIATNDLFGTFGVLFDEVTPFCLTVERIWKDNKVNESCIPEGEYICKRYFSPKFGHTWIVTDVKGRSFILFHKGNIYDDSHGCIVLGEYFNFFKSLAHEEVNKDGLASSGEAFTEFTFRTRHCDEFKLIVEWKI